MPLLRPLLLLLALTLPAAAREPDLPRIEALIQQRLAEAPAPGLVVALAEGDAAPWIRSFGTAELEQRTAMRPETVLPIASITKAFVAVSVMLLQQDGRLSVEDPLVRFLPDYPNAQGITLAQLLTHTAGIPNFVAIPAFAEDQAKDWTPQELVALFRDLPPTAAPGTACQYSDAGFILLGLVVEKASGKPFGDFVRQRIVEPLGMSVAGMGSNRTIVPWRAAGYAGKAEAWENAPYVSLVAPFTAGGMTAVAADVLALGRVLQPGGPLLGDADRAAMAAPAPLAGGKTCNFPLPGASGSFGYGLELVAFDDLPGHRAVGKSGVFPGFGGWLVTFEGSDLRLVLLANGDGSLPFLVQLSHDIATLILTP